MRKFDDNWVISPQDLVGELECSHRLDLEWSVINNLIAKPPKDQSEEAKLLTDLGVAHETKIAEAQRAAGSVLDVGRPDFTPEALKVAHDRTLEAAASGVETIYQATFFTGDFLGFADFLIYNQS